MASSPEASVSRKEKWTDRGNKLAESILFVMEHGWFRFVVGLLFFASLPVCIALSVVEGNTVWLTVLIAIQLASFILLFPRTFVACLVFYKQLRPYHLFLGFCTVVITQCMVIVIDFIPAPEVLGWTWIQYFQDDGQASTSTNLLDFGFYASEGAVQAFFFLLMFLILPVAAYFEELIFRRSTKNWKAAILRCFLFGLAHLSMGVTVDSLIPLMLLGAWLTREYFEGIRRMKDRMALDAKVLNDAVLDSAEVTQVTNCTWKVFAGVGFSDDDVVPGGDDWETILPTDDQPLVLYQNKHTHRMQAELPLDYRLKDAGVQASTKLHLAHNFWAIVLTIVLLFVPPFNI